MFEERMAGMSAEDMIGLPVKKTNKETGEEYVEFAKLSWMKYIQDHPEERILLFLDELNRADEEVTSGLFNVLEGKVDGKFYPNLTVIAAMNFGDEYDTNIEFSDPALRRRMTFIKYSPKKTDAIEFITRNDYQKDLIEVCSNRDVNMINTATDKDDANQFEQQTTYGSFYSFNQRLKNCAKLNGLDKNIGGYTTDWKTIITKKEYEKKLNTILKENESTLEAKKNDLENKGIKGKKAKIELKKFETILTKSLKNFAEITDKNYHNLLDINTIVSEISIAGKQYFNSTALNILISKFKDLASLKSLNVIESVIKTGKIHEDYLEYKENILLKCMNEIISQPLLLKKYPQNIIGIFNSRFEYVTSLITSINNGRVDGKYDDYTDIKAKDKAEAVYRIILGFISSGLSDEQIEEIIDITSQDDNGDDEF